MNTKARPIPKFALVGRMRRYSCEIQDKSGTKVRKWHTEGLDQLTPQEAKSLAGMVRL